jgi:ATPase subunit of ABC transporter with duplicated ATPase domains
MAVKRAQEANQLAAFKAHQRKVAALTSEARGLAEEGRAAGHFDWAKAKTGATALAKNKAEGVSRTLARRARSLEKRLDRMEEPEKPYQERFATRLRVTGVSHGPNEVLTARGLRLERGGRVILDGVDLHLRRGDRLALLGPNGGGKSTLIAGLRRALAPAAGSVRHGVGLTTFWAGQNGEELAEHDTVEQALHAANPDLERHAVFALLASLGLPAEPSRPLTALSGGQRTRLALARLSVTRAQLLLLDEPTNNLDLDAIEALEQLLANYPGTVLFASHDRRLVEAVATRRLHVQDGKTMEVDV